MADPHLIVAFPHIGPENAWRNFIRSGLEGEGLSFWFRCFALYGEFFPEFWDELDSD